MWEDATLSIMFNTNCIAKLFNNQV